MDSAAFAQLIERLTNAVCAGDGAAAAACFTAEGRYHDHFYGTFIGHGAIACMVREHFHRDARDLVWTTSDHTCDGERGFACYDFRYVANIAGSEGRSVRYQGMLFCTLQADRIAQYCEMFDRGPALIQLGFPDARILKSLRKSAAAR